MVPGLNFHERADDLFTFNESTVQAINFFNFFFSISAHLLEEDCNSIYV